MADIQQTILDLQSAVAKEQDDDATLAALYDEAVTARDEALAALAAAQADDLADDEAIAAAQADVDALNAAVADAVAQLGMNDLPAPEPEPIPEPEPVIEEPVIEPEPEPVPAPEEPAIEPAVEEPGYETEV